MREMAKAEHVEQVKNYKQMYAQTLAVANNPSIKRIFSEMWFYLIMYYSK